MQFIAGAKVQQLLELFHALLEDVKKKAVERLKYEGKEKDEKLLDPKSNYHQKPLEYSLAIYCYYECCKCKKPYFGGAKDCQRAMVLRLNASHRKTTINPSIRLSWCAVIAVKWMQWTSARFTGTSTLSSSASFVATCPYGFVGVRRTSAMIATRSNATTITSPSIPSRSYPSVRAGRSAR